MPFDSHKLNRDPVADPLILLIEVEEEHLGYVLRLARNNEDVVSNGETYHAASIEFSFPASGDEQDGVTLSVSNVTRVPGRSLLLARQRVTVRLMVIDFADPDEYLVDTQDQFYIGAAPIDSRTVQGKLEPVMDWLVPVPFYRTTAILFPGVWSA